MLLKMKLMEPHHLYWGILLLPVSYWGLVSSIALNELVGGILAPILVSMQVLNILVAVVLIVDDIYQHRRQVFEPSYHSPVHLAYVGAIYIGNGVFARAIRRLNEWADGKTVK